MKCGDKVLDVDGDRRAVRIFVGEYAGRYLLIHGGDEETEAFYSVGGAPLTYWADKIEEIPPIYVHVGLTYEDVVAFKGMLEDNMVLQRKYIDTEGNQVMLSFMSKDEMNQRRQ